MPRLSDFFGIAVYMYFLDHAPPHLHAIYNGEEAVFALSDAAILAGELPPRAVRLVREWMAEHPTELTDNWMRVVAGEPPEAIAPLR